MDRRAGRDDVRSAGAFSRSRRVSTRIARRLGGYHMQTLPHRAALAAIFLGCTASTAALSQAIEGPTDDILVTGRHDTDLTIPDTTGSRLGISPLDTPATVSVLDGDAIRAHGDMSIAEAESRAPGFTNVGSIGNGNTALGARGFTGQGSILQLIDGVRLFPAAGTITFPTDPWMVDRIDILSGPASVLYGQGALGGAVNVLMRKPNTSRTEAEGEIGYGSQNTFHAAAGVGGPVDDRLSYRVDASYRRSDGYVDRGSSRSLAISGTLRWAPVETLVLSVRDDYGDQHPMRYTGTPLIDDRLDTAIRHKNYNVADAHIRWQDNRTTLQLEWTPSDAISLIDQAYRLTSHRDWRDLESYCWVAADGNCPNGYNGDPRTPGDIFRTDNLGIGHYQTQWGDQGSIKLAKPLGGGISNTAVAGFDVNLVKLTYANDFASDVQESDVNPFDFDPGLLLDTQGVAPRYRTRTTEYAFFAEDRLKFGDHLSLVGGLRYEHDRVQRWTINYPASGGTSETYVLNKNLRNTTWRVGGVYQPIPTVSLYAQYSTGVDPLGTLTTYSTGQVQFSNATGNQVEVGAKASFLNGHGTATFSAYRIVKKHLLAQQTLTSPIEQVGQLSSRGIEASVSVDLPQGFGVDANGTILDAHYDSFISGSANYHGKTPPNVPDATANLWLRWNATRKLQARAGLRYVTHSFSDNDNQFRVPGYATVDATLSYALTQRLAVDVHVYNLLDKDYAITTYNDEQWILGRPRSVDVSLRAAF
jgi:iron complex outermembrane recepter protein